MDGWRGLRDGGQGLAHSGVRSGNRGGRLVGQRGLRGREGPDLPGQAGVVQGLRALVHVGFGRGAAAGLRGLRGLLRGLRRRRRGLRRGGRRRLVHQGQLGRRRGGVVESSGGQRALDRRAADGRGVGAGREDGRGLRGLRAGAGGVQVARRQAGRGVHGRRLGPQAGGGRGSGGGGVQGRHLRVTDRSDGLHHLPVVFHDLLQDLVLLVVENTSVKILLELLQKN